ncbi:Na+/H+ antiporter NhaA [Mycobacterium asiaticum]|uniref:Na(+)/H(+) antiporter NhaA n=1 Tax=Mycobacterium asiaticum TaxID=1790 RepID=A0A1A3N4N8_MYCAS|nr:Na+/H+ antiporter NhaA [Mycobacterium asiaticum]
MPPLISRSLLDRKPRAAFQRLTDLLRSEAISGVLLLVATSAAVIWANSPWSDSYHQFGDTTFGPANLHLDLSLAHWAADGLLAIFFFMIGLELKHEFLAGDLRNPRRAALPVAAALGGMVAPAAIYIILNAGNTDGALAGWAIPTATDIAFALPVLAAISTHLPHALRIFLLTLAVVDDLLAVTVIAVFYTDKLKLVALVAAVIPLILFAVAARRTTSIWILLPLAALVWYLVHESGVHATIAGVLLGLTLPVHNNTKAGQRASLQAKPLEHQLRPLSAGLAVPLFAFFTAGVTVGGSDGLADTVRDPVAIGIVTGLIFGKTLGITGAAALTAALTPAELDRSMKWVDVIGIGLLGGIGFTISLLIGEIAFADNPAREQHIKLAVLAGSLTAALFAGILLTMRNRAYRTKARIRSESVARCEDRPRLGMHKLSDQRRRGETDGERVR